MKKTFIIILAFLLVSTCLLSSCHSSEPSDSLDEAALEQKYQNVLGLIQSGEYAEAYKLILELGDYKDIKKELARFHFIPTKIVSKYAEGEGEFEVNTTENLLLNEQNLPLKRLLLGPMETVACVIIPTTKTEIWSNMLQLIAREIRI